MVICILFWSLTSWKSLFIVTAWKRKMSPQLLKISTFEFHRKRKSYRLETTLDWVNNDRIFFNSKDLFSYFLNTNTPIILLAHYRDIIWLDYSDWSEYHLLALLDCSPNSCAKRTGCRLDWKELVLVWRGEKDAGSVQIQWFIPHHLSELWPEEPHRPGPGCSNRVQMLPFQICTISFLLFTISPGRLDFVTRKRMNA